MGRISFSYLERKESLLAECPRTALREGKSFVENSKMQRGQLSLQDFSQSLLSMWTVCCGVPMSWMPWDVDGLQFNSRAHRSSSRPCAITTRGICDSAGISNCSESPACLPGRTLQVVAVLRNTSGEISANVASHVRRPEYLVTLAWSL